MHVGYAHRRTAARKTAITSFTGRVDLPLPPGTKKSGIRRCSRNGFCCIFGAAGPVGYKRWHETTSTRGTESPSVLAGLMLYSFARISAVVAMKVEDVFTQNRI
jgi:hypothetical protein